MISQKTICLYHGDCTDGAAAAAAVRRKYPDARCIPLKHGDFVKEDVSGAALFVVDFSFPAPLFRQLADKAAAVYWFDHHKSALPIRDELGFGILDLEESGASLTWKQLFPDEPVPPVVAYVRDRDIWRWELPNSREITTSLYNVRDITKGDNPIWQTLFGYSMADLAPLRDEGALIIRYERMKIEKACENGRAIRFHGHRALFLNWTDETSTIGEYIYKDLGYDLAFIGKFDGTDWKCSLRSNTVDVAEVAGHYGGGGHPGAAGFRLRGIRALAALIQDVWKGESPREIARTAE